MAVKDGDGSGPTPDTREVEDGIAEVLDEEAGLKMTDRGPRRDRWPANDFY